MNSNVRRKFIKASAFGSLGLLATSQSKAEVISYQSKGIVHVSEFGAVGDGLTDDTLAIQEAINYASSQGFTIFLCNSHLISAPLQINNNADIQGAFPATKFITPDINIVFNFKGLSFNLSRVMTTGVTLVNVEGDFIQLSISSCHCEGAANSFNEYFILFTNTSTKFNNIRFFENEGRLMCPMFADGAYDGIIYFENNKLLDSTRFIVRAINSSGDSLDSIIFKNNQILGMNSSLSDSTAVARVVQVDAKNEVLIESNLITNLDTQGPTNLVYLRSGNLTAINNICRNAHGSEAWIHDKGVSGGVHLVSGNTFDQSMVSDYTMDSIIKIYTGNNFSVKNNEFLNLRCPACWVWESVQNPVLIPKRNVIDGNVIRNVFYPFVFKLLQPSVNTVISNNIVQGVSNPDGIVQHGESVPKFLFIYVSVSNGQNLDKVTIQSNIVTEMSTPSEFVRIYRHAIALSSNISNIMINNNVSDCSEHFVKSIGSAIESCIITNNSGSKPANVFSTAQPPTKLIEVNNNFS